ncbi:MAG: hypothetical protein LW808_000930 [Verrucomicrobiota bacterium]|nr:MAG: hypothetical protein LW808_000930 [Verrucomicrobiota bacterium]
MVGERFFIFGSDAFTVLNRGEAVLESHRNQEIEVIASEATKVAEVVAELKRVHEALRTSSLFSEEKFVWYRGVSYLNDSVVLKSEAVLEWIEVVQKTLKTVPTGFLLTAGACDRRQKVVKWFLDHSQSELCESLKALDCERLLSKKIEKEQKKITSEAAALFLRRTGNETAVIDNELEKLLLYVGDRRDIEIEDIRAVVVDIQNSDFFETIDSFFQDDVERFREEIRRYFLYQEEGRPLLMALQNRVRILVQLAYLCEHDHVARINKATLEQLATRYPKASDESIFSQNPWYLSKLLPIAQQHSVREWLQFQRQLLWAIVDLSTYYRESITVFETLYFHLRTMSKVGQGALATKD